MTHSWNAPKMALLLVLTAAAPVLLNAQTRCNPHSIQGSYGFHYTGGIPGTPTYGVGVGVVSFDGAGKATSTETVTIAGTIIRGVRSSVTYTVNPDCTGTMTWTYPDFGGLTVNADIVIADNGKDIFTIGTDNGSISQGVYKRQ